MQLPLTIERAYRFKLALRMGLPIFFLTLMASFNLLEQYFNNIPISFFLLAIAVLFVSVYFIFYMIYNGLDEQIIDPVTQTFTREFFYKYVEKKLHDTTYTFMLITIDNIQDINEMYGINNGDRILAKMAQKIDEFLETKQIVSYPITHYKGGHFIIALPGKKEQYTTLLELFCLKFETIYIEESEITISGSIIDSSRSENIDILLEKLFELQIEFRDKKEIDGDEEKEDLAQIERDVITALKGQKLSVMAQPVIRNKKVTLLELTIKLIASDTTLIHQRTYMPIIQRLGLSKNFDILTLDAAISLAKEFPSQRIAITVHPTSIRKNTFLEHLQSVMTKELQERIVFIFSEKEFYPKVKHFNQMLAKYKELGIVFALDGIGVMQTSMNYLKVLNIDIARIDGALIKGLNEEKGILFFQALLHFLHDLKLPAWIKMVEKKEQLEKLGSIEQSYLQGNYFEKIESITELATTINKEYNV